MKTIIKTITPDFAKELLDKNTSNRPISAKRVSYYASLMTQGKWHLTHQGIAISENDVIIDGQHRLMAVVKADIPIKFNVTTGADDESFKFVDVGYTRTTANIFSIEGIRNYTRHAAGIGKYHNFKKSQTSLAVGNSRRLELNLTHDDYLDFYKEHEQLLININAHSTSLYSIYKILSTSEIYAFWVYCVIDAGWSFDDVNAFFQNVFMQRNDSKSNVPKLLFNKLIQNITGTVEIKATVKSALIIKAFNYHVLGKNLKRLHFSESNEKHPVLFNKDKINS